MEIRVQRTIAVLPQHARSFIKLALQTEERSQKVMGVASDVFYNAHANDDAMEFVVFTDFESMAVYEKRFLGDLLHDADYLKLAAAAVDMIRDEPLDEMFVRLQPDDYFMNLGKAKRRKLAFEKAKIAKTEKPKRFRREREYCAAKGQLRDVMQMNFDFMDKLFRGTGSIPKFFCTRFSVKRIGSTKMYFDTDESSEHTPSFIEQDEDIAINGAGLLLSRPIDRLFTRVDDSMATFSLSKLSESKLSE